MEGISWFKGPEFKRSVVQSPTTRLSRCLESKRLVVQSPSNHASRDQAPKRPEAKRPIVQTPSIQTIRPTSSFPGMSLYQYVVLILFIFWLTNSDVFLSALCCETTLMNSA